MKKFLAMLLALAMILSLAACGSKAPAETQAPETKAPDTNAPSDSEEVVVPPQGDFVSVIALVAIVGFAGVVDNIFG